MTVVDPSAQNDCRKRSSSSIVEDDLVKEGDVILSVNGQSVNGLTFPRACGLFQMPPLLPSSAALTAEHGNIVVSGVKAMSKEEQDEVTCTLVVARSKPPPRIDPGPIKEEADK